MRAVASQPGRRSAESPRARRQWYLLAADAPALWAWVLCLVGVRLNHVPQAYFLATCHLCVAPHRSGRPPGTEPHEMIGGVRETPFTRGAACQVVSRHGCVDRPIEEVFAFLADGGTIRSSAQVSSKSPRQRKGAPSSRHRLRQHGQGCGHEDQAGVQDHRVRTAHSNSLGGSVQDLITATEGGSTWRRGQRNAGHHLQRSRGHGPGKLIAPLALRSARKGANDFAGRSREPSRRPNAGGGELPHRSVWPGGARAR